ncbi:MAG TPA: hypothetical protein VEW26_04315, partial [Allosphingosinicella sp.]|nr:hypothetical protein [Allosphingosinicella sp.]
LQRHKATLSARRSAVYRGKPPFSIFGVGDYAFLPWKVAISGLYKSLRFRVFGPRDGKPVMFDDTVYFLPFRSRDEALETLALLESAEARSFLNAMIFWDEKRPITAGILRRLDLEALAALLGKQAGGGATGPACLRVGRDSGPTAAPESRRQAIRPSGPGRR